MAKKVIRSATFPGVYLRLDGNGVTHPMGPGGGVANCQYGAGPYETLDVVTNTDGTVTIGSTVFPNVFLRLDGSGLTRALDAGGGRANCQFTAGPYEKFRLVPQADGSTAIASTAFPNVFLRMDGRGVTRPVAPGGGTVKEGLNKELLNGCPPLKLQRPMAVGSRYHDWSLDRRTHNL